MTEAFLAFAAGASAIAAIASAVVAWQAPRSAARLAESLRRENEAADESLRQRRVILSELLMVRRGRIARNATAALNLIDIVFAEDRSVRDAWAELYSAYGKKPLPAQEFIEDKMNSLIKAMCKNMGLKSTLTPADLERFYYPQVLEDEDVAEDARRRLLVKDLQAASPKAAAGLFPPKPS